jgi:hypothetical protein
MNSNAPTMKKNAFTFLVLISLIFFGCSKSDNDGPDTGGKLPPPDPTAILSIASENNSSSLNFGDVVANSEKTMAITLGNTGNSTLTITDITWPEGFSGDWTSGDIPSKGQRTINVTFSPLDQTTYSGSLAVASNATATPPNFPLSGKGISDVYEGDLNILSQEELEAFIQKGYTSVTGGIFRISDENIESLQPLENLTSVQNLIITDTNCTSLLGIENLIITGALLINGNKNLASLDGFPISPGENISIQIDGNPKLESLSQLSTCFNLNWLTITNNPLLLDLDGLQNLTDVDHLIISDNDALYNFCALEQLYTSNPNTSAVIYFNRYNPGASEILSEQCQYEVPLGEYYGSLDISKQTGVDKLAAKEYIVFNGKLSLSDSYGAQAGYNDIVDLSGLSTLQHITGELSIRNNPSLTNLDGLDNLDTVDDGITITNNSQLTNFCAIVPLIQGGNYPWYTATDNLYNPTEIELQDGTCEP